VPFYEDQAAIDQARLAALRHSVFGAPEPAPPPADSGRITYAQLRVAAASDPAAFRAFWKIYGMTCLPDEVYTDPHLVARTRRRGPAAEQRTAGSLAPAGDAARCPRQQWSELLGSSLALSLASGVTPFAVTAREVTMEVHGGRGLPPRL